MKPVIPQRALEQHIAILGKTRSGKSSVMRGLVEGLLERKLPVCIVDPKGDWWGIKLARDGKRPGYPVVIFGGEHADVPINAHAGAHVAELFATGNRPCLIDLGGWMVGERTRFYIDFASTLFRLTKGMRWLAIDEIHNFAPKGKVMDPDAGKALHWTNRLASEGLGKGLPMIFASQRPQKVHNDTLTSAETLIAMRVLHPSDRGAVADWIKGCGDLELGAKVLNSLAQMERGEGWAWSPEIDFGPVRVKFPMFSTYDSFRPQTAEDAASLKGWATVDLEEVKAKLATVVKDAQANDPKLLRAEISKLRAELAKRPEAVTRAVLDPAQVKRLEVVLGALTKLSADSSRLDKTLMEHGRRFAEAWEVVNEVCGSTVAALRSVAGGGRPARALPAETLQRPQAPRRAPPHGARIDGLPAPQQRLLDTLAALESLQIDKPSRTQLAVWADVSPTSGGYFNNLGALRTLDLVNYPAASTVSLTEHGRAAARPPEPLTVDAMQAALCSKVGTPKAAILRALIDAYPDSITRADLADKVDVSPTSGGYFNNLGALRTLGLIDYPAPGQVVALPILFLGR